MTFSPSWYSGSAKSGFDDFHPKPLNKAEEDFQKLSPEAVRDAVLLASLTDETRDAAIKYHNETIPMFLKQFPAYLNNDYNMQLMQMYWQEFFGVEIPTLEQMGDAYYALRTRGVLQLNAKVVAKEDAAEVAQKMDQHIAERKAASFNEDEAYNNMSMEEIRVRAFKEAEAAGLVHRR